jgi:hypothetical protein
MVLSSFKLPNVHKHRFCCCICSHCLAKLWKSMCLSAVASVSIEMNKPAAAALVWTRTWRLAQGRRQGAEGRQSEAA